MNALLIVFVTLLFSAFFTGMEMAYTASNKLQIELEKKQGLLHARIISMLTRDTNRFLVTLLIGNQLALVLYGLAMVFLLEAPVRELIRSDTGVLLVKVLIATLFILLAGELLPRLLFRIHPNTVLKIFALPVFIFYYLFYPITASTVGMGRFLLKKVFRGEEEFPRREMIFGKTDLDSLVEQVQGDGSVESEENQDFRILRNVLDFAEVRVRDCMIPRTEIIAVDEKTTPNELRQVFSETGLSKILVYRDTMENIRGYINVKDLFRNLRTIKSKITPIGIVPETMPANKLLETLLKDKKSIALVVDEFGGTSGLVTVEDLLEEIFGEIEDEHDRVSLVEKKISDTEYIFSGRHEIDYLNEKYNLGIPESDDYDTVAGFILFHYESIPSLNENIVIDRFEFKVLKVSRTRLELVKMKVFV